MTSSSMNQPASEEPNPTLIFDTLNAYQRTGALKAAIDLKLFTAIGAGRTGATALAAACRASERGVRILCDYLTVIGLLNKSSDEYSLTSTAAAFLDENSGRYMGSVARFVASDGMMDTFRDVAGAVRRGGTLLPEGGSTKINYEPWIEFAESMGPMMMPAALFIANLVAERYPSGPLRILDVAASHGLFGLSIAQRSPQAEIVAQDFHVVLEVTRRNAAAAGCMDRYSFLPGDVMTLDLPGTYDCVLLTNFLHHFSAQACESLLRKLQARLNPNGVVVSLEFIPNEDRVTPPTPAAFALTMLMSTDHGDAYTFADYQAMFEAAGFVRNEMIDVPRAPSRLILSSLH